jgi:hypothetical protein
MPWVGMVVRGSHEAGWSIPDVEAQDEASCLKGLIQAIAGAGFSTSIEGEHDRGHGYLLEGKRADGARLSAIAWPTEFMSQGCLEIFFERLGLLAKPTPRVYPKMITIA